MFIYRKCDVPKGFASPPWSVSVAGGIGPGLGWATEGREKGEEY